MTPADEATFIQLWQQGTSYREIAQAMGCALGTVSSAFLENRRNFGR